MSLHYDMQILRSKLIAMMRLTQRTVDYSIKAMQLGRPELCRVVHNSRDEMGAIRCWIANHGRELLKPEIADADSRFICAALRISGALEKAYDNAIEIAQQSETRFAIGWIPVTAELEDAGQFVNSLLRLCSLSLLKRDLGHAKAVLHNGGDGPSLDLAVHLAPHHLTQPTSAQVRFELAIIRCLDGIAGQTREIADSIILWLEDLGYGNPASEGVARKVAPDTAKLTRSFCTVLVSETDSSLHKARPGEGAIQAREARRMSQHDESGIPSRGLGGAVPAEDFTQARLMGLQQRVCELLVKNQQLRMALIAEKAGSHHDQLC